MPASRRDRRERLVSKSSYAVALRVGARHARVSEGFVVVEQSRKLRKKEFSSDGRAAGRTAISLSDALLGGQTVCRGPRPPGLKRRTCPPRHGRVCSNVIERVNRDGSSKISSFETAPVHGTPIHAKDLPTSSQRHQLIRSTMRVKPPKSPPQPDMPGHKLVWCCVHPYSVLRAVGGEVGPPKTSHQ